MLILIRRVGEEILIDNGQIKIKLLNIRNGNVALGIHAPKEMNVVRTEIARKIYASSLIKKPARRKFKPSLEDLLR